MNYDLRFTILKNPKNEYLNTKQKQNYNFRNFKRFLSFKFVSGFGFRASCLFILASCFLLLASAPSALAQDFATSINPPIIQITAEPPAKISTPITITNSADKAVTYGIYLRPFKAGENPDGVPNYDPRLNSDYKDFLEKVQIRENDEDITEVKLSPQESKELELRISLAPGTPPIDRYFTIVFLSEPEEAENENSLTGARGGIGTNVLLSVGPKDEPRGIITDFSAPGFISKGPVPFRLELTNQNNYFTASEGTVVITNMFGQIAGALEFGPLNILANSSRLASNTDEADTSMIWDEKNPIGFYKAQAKVALSERGPLLTKEIYFFAFPMEAVLVIFLVLASFTWLFKRARKKASEAD
jgi:hypothetical protein